LHGDPIQPHLNANPDDATLPAARRPVHPIATCGIAIVVALVLLATVAEPARAAVADVRGSIAVGHTKLFATGAPAGSLSTPAGIS
jgi:hypothetical protein